MSTFSIAKPVFDWANLNQGVVSILIFITTLALGWTTGIFAALRRKPSFRIRKIDGPTFCSTFLTGVKRDDMDIHRSAFAIYLHVTNVGSAPGSIDAVHLGYHWHVRPLTLSWLRYGLGWFWVRNQTSSMNDFQVSIGENLKLFPFLFQKGYQSGTSETFLQAGQSTNGVVYFEQSDSWGGCFPSVRNNRVKIRVRIIDGFGQAHSQNLLIPSVTLEQARVFNSSFGSTFAQLRGEVPPSDARVLD